MKYNVVFRGKLTAQDKKNVADSFLKKLLKIDSSELGSIYSGKPTILKSTDSKERALDIQTKLRQLGLDTRIIIKKNTEEKKDKQKHPTPWGRSMFIFLTPFPLISTQPMYYIRNKSNAQYRS